MLIYLLTVVAMIVATALAYLYGYKRGVHQTAFGENCIGKELFELNVWWGANIARKNPGASLSDIATLVRIRREQLERLSIEELSSIAERESANRVLAGRRSA